MTEISSTACDLPGGGITARAVALVRRLADPILGGGERNQDRRNALLAFSVRVASAAILFVSQVALARWMGAAEFGVYVYAWTVVLFAGGIATVGLNVGAIRIVSEHRETGSLGLLRGFLRSSRLLVLATGVIAGLVVAGIVWWTSTHVPGPHWIAVGFAAAAIPAYALTDLQDGICRGSARIFSALVAPYILRPLMILAGIGGLHLVLSDPISATSAALVAVGATWVAWALQTMLVARDMRGIVSTPIERQYAMGAWTRTTAPLLVMSVFDLVMQHVDILVISNLLSTADAGIYFAASKTMALILFVHYAVGSAMANRFAALHTRGDAEAMRQVVGDAVRWTFWPSLALAALMLTAGHLILSLFGPRFIEGYPVMWVLAAAILVRAAIGPAEALLTMSGGQTDCARALMIAALTNIVLNLVLAPRFGILGAATAVACAIIVSAVLNWRSAKRRLGLDVGIWAVGRG